jgi:hypothetical protein
LIENRMAGNAQSVGEIDLIVSSRSLLPPLST